MTENRQQVEGICTMVNRVSTGAQGVGLGLLTVLSGCGATSSGQLPPDLVAFLKAERSIASSRDPLRNHVSLTLTTRGRGQYVLSLKPTKHSVRVLQPRFGYTLRVHFFDQHGVKIKPRTTMAVTMLRLSPAFLKTVEAQDELKIDFTKRRATSGLEGLESCRFIVVEYQPSTFALASSGAKDADFAGSALWSNPEEW